MRTVIRLGSFATSALALFVLLATAGCGEGDNLPREAVSGSVLVDGKPISLGMITFHPDGPGVSTQGGSTIVDGKYEIPKLQGLVPGKYKVVVSAGDNTPEKKVDNTNDMPGMPPIPAKETIPSDYIDKMALTAEVRAGEKNVFEFNLITRPGAKKK